ncbi:MAG TPA: MBL fold metallo-hydrolase [Pseudonocardiaceae bacterium]|nr:MBL fold metallo-hydrolase [Pseudonocardiaceae bacterium]
MAGRGGRSAGRRLGLVAGLAAAGAAAWTARGIAEAAGATATGARAERMRRSPQYRDGQFHNARVTTTLPPPGTMRDTIRELVFGKQPRHPAGPVPLVTTVPPPVTEGVHVTWYGHSSALVELDGARVLFDPVWGERVSPSALAGPRRLHPNPVPLTDLPTLDAIVISHDHYDHLDLPSVRTLLRTQRAPFVVPLGVGAHLERWRVPAERIIELDWSESVQVAGLRLVSTPAQHFSGRLFHRDGTLWTSWSVIGPTSRVFYSGDSGYFDGYAAIGAEYGPFDVTLIQIGAYSPAWPDIHMTPEEGVAAHIDLRGDLLVPVHWGTFNLSTHAWTDPADRLWLEAKARDARLAIPRPGERVDVADPPSVDGWWQALG